jgi:hypothetical protein
MADEGFVMIGAGWGRTGTTSLYEGLNKAGIKCYHMYECMKNNDVQKWIEYCDTASTMDIDDLLGKQGYRASVDYPASLFYQKQMERYPNAKVILTIRDAEKCKFTLN